jgi:toxin-antitoxin system PIN domain toxin
LLLLDVNVVLYAHRAEFPQHVQTREWLQALLASGEAFAATTPVLASVVRLATNHRWMNPPSAVAVVLDFCAQITSAPGWLDLSPGPRHWHIFDRLCRETDATGNRTPDAFLAALAIEHGCELASFDRGLRRYPGLRLVIPGAG